MTRPAPAARVYRHEDMEHVRKVHRGTLRLLLATLEDDEPDELADDHHDDDHEHGGTRR